jgi:hypothetical protein
MHAVCISLQPYTEDADIYGVQVYSLSSEALAKYNKNI